MKFSKSVAITFAFALSASSIVAGDTGIRAQDKDSGRKDIYFSVLSAAQERGPNGEIGAEVCDSDAMGNAVATFNPNNRNFCINLSYSGLSEMEVAAHIHGPAPVGENAPVLYTLSMDPIKNDCVKLTRREARQLSRGEFYFNIHTAQCPAGEIRGQILPN